MTAARVRRLRPGDSVVYGVRPGSPGIVGVVAAVEETSRGPIVRIVGQFIPHRAATLAAVRRIAPRIPPDPAATD